MDETRCPRDQVSPAPACHQWPSQRGDESLFQWGASWWQAGFILREKSWELAPELPADEHWLPAGEAPLEKGYLLKKTSPKEQAKGVGTALKEAAGGVWATELSGSFPGENRGRGVDGGTLLSVAGVGQESTASRQTLSAHSPMGSTVVLRVGCTGGRLREACRGVWGQK